MFIGFIVPNAEASDIEILEINYNNNYESGDAVVIVESGKNTTTSFKYSFFDDNDDFPDDWNILVEMMEKTIGLLLEKTST